MGAMEMFGKFFSPKPKRGDKRHGGGKRRVLGKRLKFESLESRTLLSAAPVSLFASPNPAIVGQPVYLTATVPGQGGTVNFRDGTPSIASATVPGRSATALNFSYLSNTSYVSAPASTSLNSLTDGNNKFLSPKFPA